MAIASWGTVTYGNRMRIPLPDLHRDDWRALYVGDRARYATATSARFLDDHTLVCCSLLARKIYLVRFDLLAGSHSVIHSADTTYAGQTTQTDLCDVDGLGHVVTSNCDLASLTIYRREGDEIFFDRDLSTDLAGNFCHGARFFGPDVVVTTTLRDPLGAHFYDVHTMRKIFVIPTSRPAKDICFLPNGRAALVTTEGSPLPHPSRQSGGGPSSEVVVVEYDLARQTRGIVAWQSYPAGQLDSIAHNAGHLYAVDSPGGRVLVIDDRTLQQVDEIGGYNFPHGIDIRHGMMAVACYGTNAIHVTSL